MDERIGCRARHLRLVIPPAFQRDGSGWRIAPAVHALQSVERRRPASQPRGPSPHVRLSCIDRANRVQTFAQRTQERSLPAANWWVRMRHSTPSSPKTWFGAREQSDRQTSPCSQSCSTRCGPDPRARTGNDEHLL